ncbi:MAG: InlB B-repeat-containing protein [Nitrospirota bacterium]
MSTSDTTWIKAAAAMLALAVAGCAGGSSPAGGGPSGGGSNSDVFVISGNLTTSVGVTLGPSGSGSVTFSVKGSDPTSTFYWTVTGNLPSGVQKAPPEVTEVGLPETPNLFEAINTTFRLQGTPSECGRFPLTIQVHNPAHTIVIVPPTTVELVVEGTAATCGPPRIDTSSLDLIANVDVEPPVSIAVTGGVAPLTWSIAGASSVDVPGIPGLKFNQTTGAFYGRPTTAGTTNVLVNVTDSAGRSNLDHPVTVVVRAYKLEDFTGTWTGIVTSGYFQKPDDSFVDIRGHRLGVLLGNPVNLTDVNGDPYRADPLNQGTLGALVLTSVPEGLKLGTSSGGYEGLLSGQIPQLKWHLTCDPNPNLAGTLQCVGHHYSGVTQNDAQVILSKVSDAQQDTAAPAIASSNPANQSSGAATFPLTVTFSEPMSGTASVAVTQGTASPGAVTFTDLATAVIPLTGLNSNTTYTVTLNPTSSAGDDRFQDLAGNPLQQTSITFTTGLLSTAKLTINKSGTGTGDVGVQVGGFPVFNCNAAELLSCAADFSEGTTVTLTAAPSGTSDFQGWSGACSGAGTCQVTLDADTVVTARFDVIPSYVLTVNLNSPTVIPGGYVTVNPIGDGDGCNVSPTACTWTYLRDTAVTLNVVANPGHTFVGWSNGCTGTAACNVTMTQPTSLMATFELIPDYVLTVTPAGGGTGTVTSNPAGITCGATCAAPYSSGTNVTLTAAPATGSVFVGWSGTGISCPGTGSCSVSMTQAQTVTATFDPVPTYTLTVSKGSSTGTGTVTSNPAGITCGATCAAPYSSGTNVTLTAAPATGSVFVGWSGTGISCPGTGSCSVSMTQAQTVTATFDPVPTYTLTVSKGSSTGTGTVTSNPAGITCGATCAAPYSSGTNVTLTATPNLGSVFAGWSSSTVTCTGTGPCSVSMTQAHTVTATFNSAPIYTLTVSKAGTGVGTVTSDIGGVNCGATCSVQYTSGTNVALSAVPQAGSVFAGWSGACGGTLLCNVTMTGDLSVTATFNTITYALTVSKTGTGTGIVTSNPSGIDCGATCVYNFNNGTGVTLTAVPDTGSFFSGWSGGGCTGTASCTVTMNAATTVTATFTNSAGVNLPPTAQSLTMTRVPTPQYTDPIYNRRYAFPLAGSDPEGGPLTFRITRFPGHQDPANTYNLALGAYYRLVNMSTGTFTSLWPSPTSAVVDTTTGDITGSPYFVYTPLICHILQFSTDSFEYVAIDDYGNVSAPATITINYAFNTCNHPS